MGPSKAPRVDAFSIGFFLWHWALMKDAIVAVALGFHNDDYLPYFIKSKYNNEHLAGYSKGHVRKI
jgi:hypothetical protein